MKFSIAFIITLVFFNADSQTPKKSELVSLNGTNIYYEVYGRGEPLFLLHGYFVSSKAWLPFIADYASNFEVYLIDLKGHGKSGRFNETLSIKAAAKDLDTLIKHLKLKNIHAIGMSYGGDILFQLALLHPGILKSMISIGACGSWDVTNFPDWLDQYSRENVSKLTWMRDFQMDETQTLAILDQFPNYKVSISDEQLKRIQTKTLVVLGDQDDSIPMECVARLRNNLPNFYLWILPNSGHPAHEGKNKIDFVKTSKEFINGQWKKQNN